MAACAMHQLAPAVRRGAQQRTLPGAAPHLCSAMLCPASNSPRGQHNVYAMHRFILQAALQGCSQGSIMSDLADHHV